MDYYAILGVAPDAENIVIEAAFKALAKKYHPDVWKGEQQDADEKIKSINEAYSVLRDPQKRKKYDAELASENSAGNYDDYSQGEDDVSLEVSDEEKIAEYYPDAELQRRELAQYPKKPPRLPIR